ncbi:glycosyltransferase [Ancylomarina sp. YFZ004]
MTKIAYIVLNYCSFEDTLQLVRSIRTFDSSSPIIVVDNCSPDNSRDIFKKNKEKLDYDFIVSETNSGYAQGNNLGLEYLNNKFKIDFVFVCNPDITVKEEQISQLLFLLENDDNACLAGLQMFDEHEKTHVSAWKLPSVWDDIVISSTLLRRIFGNPLTYKEIKTVQYVDVIQGAFFIARFKDFKKIGFFDPSTFLYGEERIIASKFKSLGRKIIFDPNHSFIHTVGASISLMYPTKRKNFKLLLSSRKIYHRKYNKGYGNWLLYSVVAYVLLVEKWLIDLFIKLRKV